MDRRVSALLLGALGAASVVCAGDGVLGPPVDAWTGVEGSVPATAMPRERTERATVDAEGRSAQGMLARAVMAALTDPEAPIDVLPAACFDADDPPPPEVMAAVEALYGGGNVGYYLGNRWAGSQGDPVNLMWSFIPDGVTIPNGVGEGSGTNELFSRLDAQYAAQGGRATWIARVQSVFDRWESVTGVKYTRVKYQGKDWDDGASWGASGAAGLRGNVRISMKNIDGTNKILAYNYFPGGGQGGNMVLDRSENWGSSGNQNRFFRNVLAHEHGHGLGIQHVCPANSSKLMEPFISTQYDVLRHDELRAGQRHYGDPYEPDNSPGQATDLGTLANGVLVQPWLVPGAAIPFGSILSLDASGEQDYFKFTVAGPSKVTLTAAPVGLTYKHAAQAGNGSCPTGTDYNSKNLANLAIQLIASNGVDVIATAAGAGLGEAETIVANVPGGSYFVRVYATNSFTASQLYSLDLQAESAAAESYYMAFAFGVNVPEVGVATNEDIVKYDPTSKKWSFVFDGSDVGLGPTAISAFTFDNDTILMSFTTAIDIPGLLGGPQGSAVTPQDIVRFVPSSLGANTSGIFIFYFDGSDVGLDAASERIAGITFSPEGKLLVSPAGVYSVPGLSGTGHDLIQFNAVSLGAETSGTWTMYFDGSDVDLAGVDENIDAASVRADGSIVFSTVGPFSVPGVSGTNGDLLLFKPAALGDFTFGTYEMFQELSALGISGNVVGASVTSAGPDGTEFPPGCPADLNGDEKLDLFDFLAFSNLFNEKDDQADMNGDGIFNLFDFLEFSNLFNAGC